MDKRSAETTAPPTTPGPGKLCVKAAARKYELRDESLREAVAAGRVRATLIDGARGQRWELDEQELRQDLQGLRCRHAGCDRIALGESRRCRYHVAELVRPGADPTPATRARMAAGHRGKTLTPQHRTRISLALGGREERACARCGASFESRPSSRKRFCGKSCSAIERWATKRDRILPPLRAANAARALYASEERSCQRCGRIRTVSGSRLHSGRGRFCSRSCAMRWQWENRADGLRRRRRGRVVACPGCRAERYRQPSDLGTGYCRRCLGRSPEILAKLEQSRDRRRAVIGSLKVERGLLDRQDVLERCGGVSPQRITYYVARSFLSPEQDVLEQHGELLFRPAEVNRFLEVWGSSTSPVRTRWHDEGFVARWSRATGNIPKFDPGKRRQLLLGYGRRAWGRSGGRPRKDELKSEFKALFYERRRELPAGWSDWQVCVSVADMHIRHRPEAWPKYTPLQDGGLRLEDEAKAAGRIWMVVR